MRRILQVVMVGVVVAVLVGACAPVPGGSKTVVGPGFTLLSPDTTLAPALESRTLEQSVTSAADANDEAAAPLPVSIAPQVNAATQQQTQAQSYGLYQDGMGCALGGHMGMESQYY